MSDQPFWGFGGNGLAVLGGIRPKRGDLRYFYPGLKPRAIKSATPLEFLRKVFLRKIGFRVKFIQLVDRVLWLQIQGVKNNRTQVNYKRMALGKNFIVEKFTC